MFFPFSLILQGPEASRTAVPKLVEASRSVNGIATERDTEDHYLHIIQLAVF
jgi:hypothetical protein